jgi:Fe-S-cluster-containing dehydrogenase component
MSEPEELGKTTLKRFEQYRDRWTSFGGATGIAGISEMLSIEELKEIEIFRDFNDKLLERIRPDVSVAVWRQGSVVFEEGSYVDLAFFVLDGELDASVRSLASGGTRAEPIFDLSRTLISSAAPEGVGDAGGETDAVPSETVLKATRMPRAASEITFLATMDFDLGRDEVARLGAGEFFGEIGALSGWPQSVTVRAVSEARLVQIRLPALRMMKRKSKALKRRLDEVYRKRSLADQLKNTPLLRNCRDLFIEGLKEEVEFVSCEPDEEIVRSGEPVDGLYLVRSGFVKLQQPFGEGELTVHYLSKGMTLGEVELLAQKHDGWGVTALSVEYSELVKIPRSAFEQLLSSHPGVEDHLWQTAMARIKEVGRSRRDIAHSEFTQVALDSGLVQGNSVLVIDLDRCTRCDDCVRACAATHGGRPRFVREGDKRWNLLIARSCYHCRDPVCLVGCPTGAIHRAGTSAVVAVDEEICIGCSNCANKCPYDAIVMHETGATWPGDMVPTGLRGKDREVASKCDLCHDTGHDPACVSNCPQGCAYRVASLEEFEARVNRGWTGR